jgi:integrase
MGREISARQDQAHPLGWKDIKEFIDGAGEGLRADRERAMLCVAYETLARRGELVALELRDVDFHPNGTGQALIRRGKMDAEGQGRVAYLSRETVRWLKVWLAHAGIEEGAVFRRLIGKDQIGGPLNPGSIAPILKGRRSGLGCLSGLWSRSAHIQRAWERLRTWRRWTLTLQRLSRRGGLEVDANAVAVCREDQCGESGDGESGGR